MLKKKLQAAVKQPLTQISLARLEHAKAEFRKGLISIDAGDNHLGWGLLHAWSKTKPTLYNQLQLRTYNLSPAHSFITKDSHRINLYTPEDTIVLKLLAQDLQQHVIRPLNWKSVHSVKGQGGVKQAVSRLADACGNYTFVAKTDIADYFQSMQHHIIGAQAAKVLEPGLALDLINQYCDRVEIYQGDYIQVKKGIPKGGSLSPILGNLYLRPIDDLLRKNKVFYARYVDDLVILTKTRGQLRKIMKKLYTELDKLQLKLSKPKTFIGKIARGFSFLGYAFGGCNATPHVGVSNIAISRMQDKLNELYEQHASSTRVQTYLAHWWRWVAGGLNRFKDGLLKHLKQFWRPLWLFINTLINLQHY